MTHFRKLVNWYLWLPLKSVDVAPDRRLETFLLLLILAARGAVFRLLLKLAARGAVFRLLLTSAARGAVLRLLLTSAARGAVVFRLLLILTGRGTVFRLLLRSAARGAVLISAARGAVFSDARVRNGVGGARNSSGSARSLGSPSSICWSSTALLETCCELTLAAAICWLTVILPSVSRPKPGVTLTSNKNVTIPPKSYRTSSEELPELKLLFLFNFYFNRSFWPVLPIRIRCFWPPGSGSISTRYGSGFF